MRGTQIIALFTLVAPLAISGEKPEARRPATQPPRITRSVVSTARQSFIVRTSGPAIGSIPQPMYQRAVRERLVESTGMTRSGANLSAASVQPPPQQLEVKIPAPVPVPTHGNGPVAVEFRQGQLTVAADDANLGKVLSLIGEKTGANIEIAPEVASEPVAARLGPGAPSEILTVLLSSPSLDFIIIGSDAQGMVQRLVVRKRASFGREPVAKRQVQSEPPQQVVQPHETSEENPLQTQEGAQEQPQQEQPQQETPPK